MVDHSFDRGHPSLSNWFQSFHFRIKFI